jgi:hypothetical protein
MIEQPKFKHLNKKSKSGKRKSSAYKGDRKATEKRHQEAEA